MKNAFKLLTATVLCLFVLPNKNFAQKSGYQIIIHVPAMKDTPCYLANYYGDKQYIKDTVKSDAAGTVVFQGKQALPGIRARVFIRRVDPVKSLRRL